MKNPLKRSVSEDFGRSGEAQTRGLRIPNSLFGIENGLEQPYIAVFAPKSHYLWAYYLHCFRVFHTALWDEMWS